MELDTLKLERDAGGRVSPLDVDVEMTLEPPEDYDDGPYEEEPLRYAMEHEIVEEADTEIMSRDELVGLETPTQH